MRIQRLMIVALCCALTTVCFVDIVRFRIRMVLTMAVFACLFFLMIKLQRYFLGRFFLGMTMAFGGYFLALLLTGRFTVDEVNHMVLPYFFLPFVCAGMLRYILSCRNASDAAHVLFWCLVPILTMAVLTIKAPPDSSRLFFGNAVTAEQMYDAYQNLVSGVMSYESIHCLPFLMAGFIGMAKRSVRVWLKIAGWCGAAICALTVYRSGYGACSVCTAMVFMFSVVNAKRRALTFGVAVVLGFIGWLLLKTGVVLAILLAIQPMLPQDTNLSNKINELNDQTGENAIGSEYWEGRSDRYVMSFEAFARNPIFGSKGGGGHSFVIDTLGSYGISGFVPQFVFYMMLFAMICRCLPPVQKWYYQVSGVCWLVLLIFKANAMMTQSVIFFLVMPLLLLCRRDDFEWARSRLRGGVRFMRFR